MWFLVEIREFLGEELAVQVRDIEPSRFERRRGVRG